MVRLNSGPSPRLCRLALVPTIAFILCALAWAQTSDTTGRIAGTVTDAKGIAIAGARVTVSTPAAQIAKATTDAQGAYAAEGVTPGSYTVRVEAKGYVTTQLHVEVKIGHSSDASVKLAIGSELQVNTEQASLQEVLNASQIGNLLLNGRNFLALPELEPGVQIEDGENLAPTKTGYSSLSLGSRTGRNTRIAVDGADVSDEIVGTAAEGIPISGMQAFSVEESMLDVSTDLTSSGAVNVTTKRGQNAIHGEAFGLFRDSAIGAAQLQQPLDAATHSFVKTPYQRNQEGGSLGGAIIPDKAFFFLDGERILQHLTAPVSVASPFAQYSGTYAAPFDEGELQGRVDYSLRKTTHLFGRFNYFKNSENATFFPSSFQLYSSADHAINGLVGLDFDAHNITHSIRFSYLRSQSSILDATEGTNLPFAGYPVSIDIATFSVGTNPLAPQATYQSDRQIRYDGTKTMGNHILRFGAGYNRIQVGGYAGLSQTNPLVLVTAPGTNNDPTTEPLSAAEVIVSNGQRYSSTQPAFGYPAGGLGPDNRLDLYIGDTWRYSSNLTITSGLRWERDTSRTNSDLRAIPELNSAFPGFGNAVRQPNQNFAPQLGFAWDPKGTGKTVFRIGAGLYYDNLLYSNTLGDRRLRQRTGTFLANPIACSFGTAMPLPTETAGSITVDSVEGLDPATGHSYCSDTIGQAAATLAAFQTAYQADNPFSLTAQNPNFVGTQLASGLNVTGGLLAPNYRTPRAWQINAGFQHEIRPGLILSADYLRNIETRGLLGVDINHTGAARYFNAGSAFSAVNLTVADCGAGSLAAAISPQGCPGIHPPSGSASAGAATITDFAVRGLGSAADTGSSCYTAADPSTGKPLNFQCAFSGVNPNYGAVNALQSINRSLYRAAQAKVAQSVANPFQGVKAMNLQIAYSYSHFTDPLAFQGNTAPTNPIVSNDQDLALQAADNDNPSKFKGASLFDRTHQISFAGTVDVPFGFRFDIAGHLLSPLSSPAIVGNTGTAGQIFQTDFSGSGVGSQPLPGTTNGSFMRGLDVGGLNHAISRYNATSAGQATPAGQALIGSPGVLSLNPATALLYMQTMGAVAPTLNLVPIDQLTFPWLKLLDVRLSWSHTFHDRFKVQPSVGVFNVFNIANFDMPPGATSGWLNEGSGSINSVNTLTRPGETGPESNTFRVGNGTGVFSQGSPRTIEWGLRITF